MPGAAARRALLLPRRRPWIIVPQNLPIPLPLVRHHRRADLAQPYTVPPAGAAEDEPAGFLVDHERGAVQMRPRERPPDLEFFSHDDVILPAGNLQPIDPPRGPSGQGFHGSNGAEIHTKTGLDQLRHLSGRILDAPLKEILRLLIESRKNPRKQILVPRIAVGRRLRPDQGLGTVRLGRIRTVEKGS